MPAIPRKRPISEKRVIFSWNIQCAATVTNSGARFDNSVELVTDVSLSDQCHNVRSAANRNPHAAIIAYGFEGNGLRMAQRIGSARNTRQNAVAVGPVWLSRTQIGANPIPIAPSNAARSAHLDERVCTQLDGS